VLCVVGVHVVRAERVFLNARLCINHEIKEDVMCINHEIKEDVMCITSLLIEKTKNNYAIEWLVTEEGGPPTWTRMHSRVGVNLAHTHPYKPLRLLAAPPPSRPRTVNKPFVSLPRVGAK
jgi:hypothetical protein